MQYKASNMHKLEPQISEVKKLGKKKKLNKTMVENFPNGLKNKSTNPKSLRNTKQDKHKDNLGIYNQTA